jgi:hypothetical protein
VAGGRGQLARWLAGEARCVGLTTLEAMAKEPELPSAPAGG